MKQDLERVMEKALTNFMVNVVTAMIKVYGEEKFLEICKDKSDLRTVVESFAAYGVGELANYILEEVL